MMKTDACNTAIQPACMCWSTAQPTEVAQFHDTISAHVHLWLHANFFCGATGPEYALSASDCNIHMTKEAASWLTARLNTGASACTKSCTSKDY